MSVYQVLFFAVAFTLPAVTVVAIVRSLWCGYRAARARQVGLALLSFLTPLILIALFSVALAAWFGYAVAHTGKDVRSDLILLSVTGIPVWLAAYGSWKLSGHVDRNLMPDGA